jgi:hypothetical protein
MIFYEGVGRTIFRGDAGGTGKVVFIDDSSAEVGGDSSSEWGGNRGAWRARDMEVAIARSGCIRARNRRL